MTIFICGDSTAASYQPAQAPQTGWGQVLNEYVPDCEVVNAAFAGRSTKSFISEGRLVEVEKQVKPGDLLLIQFTHNDESDLVWRHTDAWTGFRGNLEIFIDTARLHGAIPVLLTPIPLRTFENGAFAESHGVYPDAMRVLAKQKGVPLIDVYAESANRLREMGDEESRRLYMNIEPGVYANIPDGRKDNAHTQRAGACFYAEIVARGLKEQGLI